ncbi:MAG: glycosyltransferase family 4 protein [Azospirillum brasilense]|nr:MAG: glycosyltransferase family 4 protein [Azospirillum brasilense]
MKIAIISHLKFPIAEPFSGGLEMHTHLLARHLQRRGHEVTLLAAEGSDARLGLEAVCPPTGVPGPSPVEIEQVALAEHTAYRRIVERLQGGCFDIIHNNSLHYLPLTMSGRFGAPVVTSLHTPPFLELENGVLDREDRDMPFIGVSEAVRKMWEPVLPGASVIGNGIDLDLFTPVMTPAEPPHAIWFGRLVPEKGPHLAIRAARLAGMPLRFAGPISDIDYWRDCIRPLLGEGVTYLGHLDHKRLAHAVGQAAVALCTPRWEEPYGLVVAEALACGTPVAGFARGALPDITDPRSGRLAPADDVEALARIIPEAGRLSRADCRHRAEVFCDARVMVDRYEALYRDTILRHRRVAMAGRSAVTGMRMRAVDRRDGSPDEGIASSQAT